MHVPTHFASTGHMHILQYKSMYINPINCSRDNDSVLILQVGDNDLVYISHKAFSGLTGLEDLTIERCNLTSISGQTLSYLRNLVTLRLRHLSISALEDQNFRKLSALRGLEVDSWPYLEYISPLSFQGLNLSWLFITNTNISSVPSGLLQEPGLPDGPEPLLQPHLHARVLGLSRPHQAGLYVLHLLTCMSCDRERVKIVSESLKMLQLLKWGKNLFFISRTLM